MIRGIENVTRATLAGALLVGMVSVPDAAHAGKEKKNKTSQDKVRVAQAALPQIETMRLRRGEEVTLPLDNVTKIVVSNPDVARARFEDGKALIEGVVTGITTVDIQQSNAGLVSNQRYEVEVLNADTPAQPVTATATTTTTTETVTTGAIVPADATTTGTTPTDTTRTAAIPPDAGAATALTARNLTLSLNVEPAEDNPSQALFTLTYGNPTPTEARNVVIRYALDDVVSYVTASATGGARYDAAARELVWNLGTVPAGETGKTLSFRIAALDSSVDKFYSAATIESEGGATLASNQIEYSFNPTPLLTVFALPDRILEGRTGSPLVDVRGIEYQAAIERLQTMGVLEGTEPGRFHPGATTRRAEYAVMILRGLNLKDLRDISAIKFVLSRPSTVSVDIRNSAGRVVATLLKNRQCEAGENLALWNGRTTTGFAPAGRYSYTCTARDASGTTTTLRGFITVVSQEPLNVSGVPTFIDVEPKAWYSGYLAEAERQGLVQGYPTKEFRPKNPINRVEATAVVVRAIGLEDLARRNKDKNAGFLDDHVIPDWATGYVYVASTIAKTNTGKLIVGYPSNMYMPMNPMRRDEAALVIQRLVDKETNRKISISGQVVPGAKVTINSQDVQPAEDGQFSFVIEQNSTEPTSVAVIDRRR